MANNKRVDDFYEALEEYSEKVNHKDFRDMDRNEKMEAIKIMPALCLFTELEDTVQYDIRRCDNHTFLEETGRWDTYRIITNELKRRLGIGVFGKKE